MTARRLLLPLLVAACAAAPSVAQAASTPKPGRYAGTHGFDGPITLVFERESGIGLHLARFSFSGTLRCADGTTIPYRFTNRRVTARSAARVTKGRFTAKSADITISGRFGAKGVSGDVKLRAIPCEKTVAFSAKRR
ncbi:MAG: hypothetical protein MUC84_10695 [Solirubrobacteraceae bacterium]|jgi:hypothetical protein|nr:hypothetical protein [Solirubrobacteraceae bacterium]MCU0314511.1 hypothetical protein [Solirubrobacteraceae bacterium]